jgi:hypothetical protein
MPSACRSVFVVVFAVSRVPATVVHVVDMVPVRDGDMAAALTVDMLVLLVHRVAGRLAFVVVIPVPSMNVTVVHEVDVVPVGDGDMAASFAVHMVMFDVGGVGCAGHCISRRNGFHSQTAGAPAILVTVVERHQVQICRVGLANRFPEAGEGVGTARGVLHHPPVPQPVEHLRAGPGPVGGPAPVVGGADVWVVGGQQ